MELTTEQRNELIKKIEETDKNNISSLIAEYKQYELKGAILGRVFEKLYVNAAGFSSAILISDLEKIHHSFHTTNGGDWCRSKVSYLGKKYILIRVKKGSSIYSVKCDGPERENRVTLGIRQDILSSIRRKRCVILDISSNIECDHKEGMKDDNRLNAMETQTIDDFQPLCKTANDAKRSHCKKCVETHKRYDATKLGYSVSFIFGDEDSKTCVGCYWYDPREFNKTISKDFKKED